MERTDLKFPTHRLSRSFDFPSLSLPDVSPPIGVAHRLSETRSNVDPPKVTTDGPSMGDMKRLFTLEPNLTPHLEIKGQVSNRYSNKSIIRAAKEKIGRNACVEGLMQKVRLFRKTSARTARVEALFKRLWSQGEIIASIMRELLDYDGLEIWIDCESSTVVNLIEEIVSGSGEKRRGDTCRSYVHRSDNRIYLGIKETEDITKLKILGYLADSMAHIVCDRMFQNGGRPYLSFDINRKRRFKSIVVETREKSNKEDLNQWIKWAIGRKTTFDQETDLITAVPAIIAEYGTIEGIYILESQVPELYDFFVERVKSKLPET